METAQILIVVIQILMAIISLIGGALLMSMREAIRELRCADDKLSERLKDYARNDEVREWRREQRDEARLAKEEQAALFERLFKKLDDLQEKVANKADRA